jgi:alginate O-acetyltransferase complex protein AlgI
MIFNTWTFACFATIVVLAYWTLVPMRARPWYLFVVGCVFYAWAVPAYLILIACLAVLTYVAGRALLDPDRPAGQRRAILTVAVVAIAGALVVFKYTKFLATTVDQVAQHTIVPIPQIVVPLAISFFTFEFVHVLVDIYQRKISSFGVRDFAVFTMFFPTLVAGPIKRFQSFAPQLDALEPPPTDALALNLYRIAIGVFKKVVIADSMSVLTQPILTPGAPYGRLDYWVAMLAYTAKIYFDFSGYSDIAIGVAGVLGLRIPENFDRPYWAHSIAMFWRRWHMSLSTWIRDYIFIPLGGSRGKSPLVTALNLFIAMAIAGLWHGAAFTFILWGLWHGLGLAVHRAWGTVVVPRVTFLGKPSFSITAASTLSTFLFVAFGWVLFAATSLASAGSVYAGMLVR